MFGWLSPKLVSPDVNRQDRIFALVVAGLGVLILVLLFGIVMLLAIDAWPALSRYGLGFLTSNKWDPVFEDFGAAAFIFGTLVTSGIALLLATPVAVGAALFLTEDAPPMLASWVGFLIELLAAIPSIIYGLWGFFVLAPVFRFTIEPFLRDFLGPIPIVGALFQGTPIGKDLLVGGAILAIMILPTITAISREIIRAVPTTQREGMLALGATRWETIRGAVLPYARIGIVGAVLLGLARALGETMAVTMVVGNSSKEIRASLFTPGYTMASAIANQFTEADKEIYFSAIVAVALALMLVTAIVNILARMLVAWFAARTTGRSGMTTVSKAAEPGPLLRASSGSYQRRRIVSGIATVLMAASAAFGTSILLIILGYVIFRGLPALNFAFFTERPLPYGEVGGGVGPAILGSLMLILVSCLIGIPIAIGTAIYLTEFGHGRLAGSIRFSLDQLAGLPSIVVGVAVWAILVRVVVGNYSGVAGGVALAIIMIPIMTRTVEETLRLVPDSLREASFALGVPRWRTIMHVVLPTAKAGILTGAVLSLAGAAGETAPLLLTTLGNQFFSFDLSQPMAALPVQIYNYAVAPYDDWHTKAWGGALVLVALIGVLSILTRVVVRGKRLD